MAAKIEQFRKLHVVGEPLVLHDIWDRVIAQEPRENVSSLRGEGARTLRPPSQAYERFGRKQFSHRGATHKKHRMADSPFE